MSAVVITRIVWEPDLGTCLLIGEDNPDGVYTAATGSEWRDRLTGNVYTKTATDDTSWSLVGP